MLLFSLSTGVIITDNIMIYTGELSSVLLNTADTVTIIEPCGDFFRIDYFGYTTDVHKDVCVDLAGAVGPEMLLLFGKGYLDAGEYRKAADLLLLFTGKCAGSRYMNEALLLLEKTQKSLNAEGTGIYTDTLAVNDPDAVYLIMMADQNRILFESCGETKYKKKAIKYYKKILKKYDGSCYSAWARVSIFELKTEKKLY